MKTEEFKWREDFVLDMAWLRVFGVRSFEKLRIDASESEAI